MVAPIPTPLYLKIYNKKEKWEIRRDTKSCFCPESTDCNKEEHEKRPSNFQGQFMQVIQ